MKNNFYKLITEDGYKIINKDKIGCISIYKPYNDKSYHVSINIGTEYDILSKPYDTIEECENIIKEVTEDNTLIDTTLPIPSLLDEQTADEMFTKLGYEIVLDDSLTIIYKSSNGRPFFYSTIVISKGNKSFLKYWSTSRRELSAFVSQEELKAINKKIWEITI